MRQWLAAGVLRMADVFSIPRQLLAVSVICTVIYTTANVGHGVLWLCVRLWAATAGYEWSASSGSAFCRRGGRGCGGNIAIVNTGKRSMVLPPIISVLSFPFFALSTMRVNTASHAHRVAV